MCLETRSRRANNPRRYFTAAWEFSRYLSTLPLVILGLIMVSRQLWSKQRPACAEGEMMIGYCHCENYVIEKSTAFCRDLENERECQQQGGVYSYYSRSCTICARNQIFNRILGICEDCSDGLVSVHNQCVTPVQRCNYLGMKYDGTACVACASGSQLSGNECVANSKPAETNHNRTGVIVAVVIVVLALLILVIVVVVVQRRKAQVQHIGFRDTEPSALGGDGQIENTLAPNYKFDA